jgi:hypothetical protein
MFARSQRLGSGVEGLRFLIFAVRLQDPKQQAHHPACRRVHEVAQERAQESGRNINGRVFRACASTARIHVPPPPPLPLGRLIQSFGTWGCAFAAKGLLFVRAWAALSQLSSRFAVFTNVMRRRFAFATCCQVMAELSSHATSKISARRLVARAQLKRYKN